MISIRIIFLLAVIVGLFIAEHSYLSKLRSNARHADAVHLGLAKSETSLSSSSSSSSLNSDDPYFLPFSEPPRNKLEEYLRKIAPTREVLIAISNSGLWWGGSGPLKVWLDAVQKSNVPNYMLVALDEQVAQGFQQAGGNAFLIDTKPPEAQAGTGDNHAYSAAKFGILRQFLELGWSVLLSDVDIVTVKNPFDHLYRDADIEGMSDGFDEATAYGHIGGIDDPSMGWARYAQTFERMAMNSGLFYTRSNNRTVRLMTEIDTFLQKTKYWDQTAFNEFIFRPSHGSYKSPGVSARVMDMYEYMNSKVMFKTVRHLPESDPKRTSLVMFHSNYHPDKLERCKAVYAYYHLGDKEALKRFPGGSEPGS